MGYGYEVWGMGMSIVMGRVGGIAVGTVTVAVELLEVFAFAC